MAFVQMMHQVFVGQQMSSMKGMKKFGDGAMNAMKKELGQMHMRDGFAPKLKNELNEKQLNNVCEAVNPMKQKKDGKTKGRTCADGRKQRHCVSKEESASPTAHTKSEITTGVMEAKEKHKVTSSDVPNAFMQTKVDNPEERMTLVLRGTAANVSVDTAPEVHGECSREERGDSVLHLECTNVIHGALMAALLFHRKFRPVCSHFFCRCQVGCSESKQKHLCFSILIWESLSVL
mgnify:CR=1 FL=1